MRQVAAMSGVELAEARRTAGLTQVQLSDLLAVTVVSVKRWEAGVVPITKSRAFAINRAVEVAASLRKPRGRQKETK